VDEDDRRSHGRSLRLVTIGYEGRSLDQLVRDLLDDDVAVLVDVRLKAMSRKRGFAKSALSAGCTSGGIDYVHEPTLGNPRENREPFHRGDAHAWRVYEDRMVSVGADALERLRQLVPRRRVALLCYERDARICHRSVIAGWLRNANPAVDVIDR
jgi:uncharacterized protein (DUF488 family)